MPSLLSISRGAFPSCILRRHHFIHKNIVLDASSNHHLRHYSRLSSATDCDDARNNRNTAASSARYLFQRNESFGSRSMSAAAVRNDSSPSKRIKLSSATSSAKYNKSHKQSAADNKRKPVARGDRQQRGGAADWRAWFSSSEYDDAWSPYRPLRPSSQVMMSSSNSIANNTQNTVENIITNYNDWERRRHGMNLPPLTLDMVSTTESKTDNNFLQLTKLHSRTQRINTQTRFTIQLLNDLYLTGIRRQMDRPTMERCHRLIGRLLSLSPREGGVFDIIVDNDDDGKDSANDDPKVRVQVTGAAQRGNAILERMEWCSPAFLPQLRKWQRWHNNLHRKGGGGELEALLLAQDDDVSWEANNNGVGMQSRSVDDYHTNKVPKHLLETKQAIPTPTRAIYNMVLLLYGKEAGSRDVAEQAEDVVWSMIVRGLQLEEFNMTHSFDDTKRSALNTEEEDEISLPIYPNTQNWNCVLKCWSNSSDPNRAFFAYSFFKSWMEWNVHRGKVMEHEEGASCCDLETFHFMLKSCLVDEYTVFDDDSSGDDGSTNTDKKVTSQRAKEVGSRVAIGIWKDLRTWKDRKNENTLTSETYLRLLKALCQTSELSRGLLATVAAIFQSCQGDGLETKQITNLVRGVMTESQFQKLLRIEAKSAASTANK